VGLQDTLWKIDLTDLQDFHKGNSEFYVNPEWKEIVTQGLKKPKPMSHMTSVVHDDVMYLFGGSTNEGENCEIY
jgi:hypothetical protein